MQGPRIARFVLIGLLELLVVAAQARAVLLYDRSEISLLAFVVAVVFSFAILIGLFFFGRSRRPLVALVPAVGFVALCALFYLRLGAGDASRIPSPLVGKPVPAFALPPVTGLAAIPGLADADLRQGQVTLVNVFASWCQPCHIEHPVLQGIADNKELAALGVRLTGIAYRDDAAKTTAFLAKEGNPYGAVGADSDGRAGIDWGVYGVPETFVVRGDGIIAYKFVGPMTAEDMRNVILPEIAKAMR